ncbi:MAG TPA: reactive intermediate/imine deaminase [Anaerolineae bacterium]|nr:reactive intermediate/imine deaminase [Anaerolineae bacterium]
MNKTKKEILATSEAPPAIGPYSQGIRFGNLIFASGSAGVDPESRKLVEGGIEAQTRQTLINLSKILESAGSSLSQVLKTTVFLEDMHEFAKMNAVYAEFFDPDPPARSTIQAAALPLGAAVEIEAIAFVD